MKPAEKKNEKKNFFLLLNIAFWHFLASAMAIHVGVLRHSYLNLKSINYWFWVFAWWSYLTSLLTIIWVIYKLASKKNNYFSQVLDLVITSINVVDTVFIFGLIIYYLGGGKFQLITTPPKETKWIEVYWIIYNFIWHIIAPGLVIYYFLKFSPTDLLEKKYKWALLNSLLFPTTYFFYVILRPLVDKYYSQEIKLKIADLVNTKNYTALFPYGKWEKLNQIYQDPPQAYQMPKDYPYPFFYRCMGKKVSHNDKGSKYSQIIWIIGTFLAWYLIFVLLAYLLLKSKKWFISRQATANSLISQVN